MCDYSLMAVPNRMAKEGEDLVVYRFPTGSLGLASAADIKRLAEPRQKKRKGLFTSFMDLFSMPRTEAVCAVCIPPGARLRLRDIPQRLQQEVGVGPQEEVTFTQITAAANAYRDAVRFPHGRVIRLQELREGQRVRVLDLSLAEEPTFEALREERGELSFRQR